MQYGKLKLIFVVTRFEFIVEKRNLSVKYVKNSHLLFLLFIINVSLRLSLTIHSYSSAMFVDLRRDRRQPSHS